MCQALCNCGVLRAHPCGGDRVEKCRYIETRGKQGSRLGVVQGDVQLRSEGYRRISKAGFGGREGKE